MLAAEGTCFFDKLCMKYHDYLDLIGIDLMKSRHRRVSKCGIEKFEKSSTFYKKLFYKQHKKIVNSKKVTKCSAKKKYFFHELFCKSSTVHGIP